MNVIADVSEAEHSVLALTRNLRRDFASMVATWESQPSEEMSRALPVIALAVEETIIWKPDSDMLVVRILSWASCSVMNSKHTQMVYIGIIMEFGWRSQRLMKS